MKDLTIEECLADRNLWQGRAFASEELCSYVMDELIEVVTRLERIDTRIPDDIHCSRLKNELQEVANKARAFVSATEGTY